jgi:hypothetical protein
MQQSESYLIASGWHDGRRVDAHVDLDALRREGYDLWSEAEDFLAEFSGLAIRVHDRDPMIIDAADAVDVTYRSWVDAWSRRAGTYLIPVGAYSHLTVLLGRDGWLYGGYDNEFGRLGQTLAEVVATTLIPEHPDRLGMPLEA